MHKDTKLTLTPSYSKIKPKDLSMMSTQLGDDWQGKRNLI